ncbi:histidine--tRNA ligase [bacterium]|nr:histidine--tRNA ligase [bacterium]
MRIKSPKGVSDIFGKEANLYQYIEDVAISLFNLYGYSEIRTPIFEETEVFTRSVGDQTDIGKQMYTFYDKKQRLLSLRPENTAGVIRAYIEHSLYASSKCTKLYYLGPMFRYERPQKGRMRQFYQLGTEAIGSSSPLLDAEVIAMALHLLSELGINGYQLRINNIGCKKCQQTHTEQILLDLKKIKPELCNDCQERAEKNPRRILDCKNKLCQERIKDFPGTLDLLCKDCKDHFSEMIHFLELLEIDYTIDSKLVRGLDYYCRTVFEIQKESLGAQNTIAAGGRYDYLVEELGGPSLPAVGFSAGLERMILSMDRDIPEPEADLYIAYLPDYIEEAFLLANNLRKNDFFTLIDLEPKSLKNQLKEASSKGAIWTVIIGDEIRDGKVILKDMRNEKQIEIKEEELIEWLSDEL